MIDGLLEFCQMDWWLFWVLVCFALGLIGVTWHIDFTSARNAADLRRRKKGCPK